MVRSKFQSKLKMVALGMALSAGLLVGCSSAQSPSATDGQSDTAQSTDTQSTDAQSTDAQSAEPSETAAPEAISIYVEDGVAIKGADPVAYFTEEAYVAGSPDYTHDWMGATWHFSSAENRDLFASNPTQYAPKYGGYCAWAVSQGNVAPVDPTAWKIVDGALYLNYDARIQAKWAQDIPGNIAKADENWPGVLSN